MSLSKPSARDSSVERFWNNYLIVLKNNAVPKTSLTWCCKHAEAYIKANKTTPLSKQTDQDVAAI